MYIKKWIIITTYVDEQEEEQSLTDSTNSNLNVHCTALFSKVQPESRIGTNTNVHFARLFVGGAPIGGVQTKWEFYYGNYDWTRIGEWIYIQLLLLLASYTTHSLDSFNSNVGSNKKKD